jgi:hypothetical protein
MREQQRSENRILPNVSRRNTALLANLKRGKVWPACCCWRSEEAGLRQHSKSILKFVKIRWHVVFCFSQKFSGQVSKFSGYNESLWQINFQAKFHISLSTFSWDNPGYFPILISWDKGKLTCCGQGKLVQKKFSPERIIAPQKIDGKKGKNSRMKVWKWDALTADGEWGWGLGRLMNMDIDIDFRPPPSNCRRTSPSLKL